MESNKYDCYFCNKCKMIPQFQIFIENSVPKVYTKCKCHSQRISQDLFIKNYYKKGVIINDKYEKIDDRIEDNLNEKISEFSKIKEEFNQYLLMIKNTLINLYNNKIKEVENEYIKNIEINDKTEKIMNTLINIYKNNPLNNNNFKNLDNNLNLNKSFKNEQLYENLLNYMNPSDNTNKKYYIQNNVMKYFDKSIETLHNKVINFFKNSFYLNFNKNSLRLVQNINEHSDSTHQFIQISNNLFSSCGDDQNIVLYKIKNNKYNTVHKFKAHEREVLWIAKLKDDVMISCGNDNFIKIWSFDNLNFDDENTKVKSLCEFQTNQNLRKIIPINENEFIGNNTKEITLFKHLENKGLNSISKINNINMTKIIDLIFMKNKNYIITYESSFLTSISINNSSFSILNKMNVKSNYNQNCLVQLNDNNVLFVQEKEMNIINVNHFQKTLVVKSKENPISIFKLNDNTLIKVLSNEGLSRISLKTMRELPPLIIQQEFLDDNYSPRKIISITHLDNNHIVLCYRDSTARISIAYV